MERFREAMDDDFDTPAALAYVFELVRDANAALDAERDADAATLAATVRELWTALGLSWLDDDDELVQPGDGRIGMLGVGGAIPLGYYKDDAKTATTFRTASSMALAAIQYGSRSP